MSKIIIYTDGGARNNHQTLWETLGFSPPSSTGKQCLLFPVSLRETSEISATQNQIKSKAVCFLFHSPFKAPDCFVIYS